MMRVHLSRNALLGLGATAVLLTAGVPSAFAAQNTTSPPASRQTVKHPAHQQFWQHELGALSKIIGTSVPTLQSDVQQGMALPAVLQQAGLTQQQFNQRLHAAAHYLTAQKRRQALRVGTLARILHLSPSTLRSDLKQHETIAAIAKAQGVTPKQLRLRLHGAAVAARRFRFVLAVSAKTLGVTPKVLRGAIHAKTAANLLSAKNMSLGQFEAAVNTAVDAKIKNPSRDASVNQRIDQVLGRVFAAQGN